MSRAGLQRVLLMVLLTLLLASCRSAAPRGDQQVGLQQQLQREALLKQSNTWSLVGRLAVSGAGEGGSGTLRWTQRTNDYRFEVQAPVTRQTWRLDVRPGNARLEGLVGGVRLGPDPIALLASEVGWDIPLRELAHWVRGARAPGASDVVFAEDGLPIQLVQANWVIDYREWDRSFSPPLPSKVFAQSGQRKVRLIIEDWRPGTDSQ